MDAKITPRPLKEWLRAYNRSSVARAIGVDAGTVSRWYRESAIPSGDKLQALADFLGVDPRLIILSRDRAVA